MSEDNRPLTQSIKTAKETSRIVAWTVTPEKAELRDALQQNTTEEEDTDIMVTTVEHEKLDDTGITPKMDPTTVNGFEPDNHIGLQLIRKNKNNMPTKTKTDKSRSTARLGLRLKARTGLRKRSSQSAFCT